MQQLQGLPLEQRALALKELGLQVEVEQKKTDTELTGKATAAYQKAVRELDIPACERQDPYTYVEACRGSDYDDPYKMSYFNRLKKGSMMMECSRPSTEGGKKIQAFYDQVSLLEKDANAINLSDLEIHELIFLLKADSKTLAENGVKQRAAELAKQKILDLPLPEDAEDFDTFLKKNRDRYVSSIELFHILENVQINSTEELTQLFAHLYPSEWLSKQLGEIINDSFYRKMPFTKEQCLQAACHALKIAPNQAFQSIKIAASYSSEFLYQPDANRIHGNAAWLAQFCFSDDALIEKLTTHLDSKYAAPLRYYTDSLKAKQEAFDLLPDLQQYSGNWCWMIRLGMTPDHFQFNITSFDRTTEISPEQKNALIKALSWIDLIEYRKDFRGLDRQLSKEIFRQIRGDHIKTLRSDFKRLLKKLNKEEFTDFLALIKQDQIAEKKLEKSLSKSGSLYDLSDGFRCYDINKAWDDYRTWSAKKNKKTGI